MPDKDTTQSSTAKPDVERFYFEAIPRRLHGDWCTSRNLQDTHTGGIIEKVNGPTDWVSSIVIVGKPNGDVRICLDPKRLNDAIIREHHYTHKLEDVLPQLSNAKVFSKLDTRSGYWNVILDKESKFLTTFNTPFGRYCFKRLPFGLVSTLDIFQRKIDDTYMDCQELSA